MLAWRSAKDRTRGRIEMRSDDGASCVLGMRGSRLLCLQKWVAQGSGSRVSADIGVRVTLGAAGAVSMSNDKIAKRRV
jgi:hypothetical protein